jgi:hypothetical protein
VIIFGGSIFKFFSIKNSFKKEDVSWKEFLEDLGLSIVKNNLPIQFVESMWLKCSIFTRDIARVSWEDKSTICSSCIGKSFFYNS